MYGEQRERAQRLRLRRFFMSAGSYALWFALVLIAYSTDLLRAPPWVIWGSAAGLLATQGIFYALLRAGSNLRFADPSMTFIQIAIAVAWSLLLLAFTNELRGMMLAVLMVALLFGVFALDRRQFVQLAALAGGGYLAIVVLERFTRPGLYPDAYYVISTLVLVVALAWTALFGSYVSAVRHKLSARNDELQQALAKISTLAERDDLTGLYNRRFVMEVLARLIPRSEREAEPFCICIIDLDHFKRINDRFGHAAGDPTHTRRPSGSSVSISIRYPRAPVPTMFGQAIRFVILAPEASMISSSRYFRTGRRTCFRNSDHIRMTGEPRRAVDGDLDGRKSTTHGII